MLIAGMAIKFENHYSIIEGCLFLEHMPSEKNAINLKCKFAFIQLNGRYIYYNKKRLISMKRIEQRSEP